MSLELTVRGKTYKVEVDYKGNFNAHMDADDGQRSLQAETLKGLEQKLTVATRARSAKVAIKLKRLGRSPKTGRYGRRGWSYGGGQEDGPWEVIVVTVRGVNEHTGHVMVTWPDGTKADDEEVGRYSSKKAIYFPMTMKDEDVLKRRNLVDETEAWLNKNSLDVIAMAKKAVAEALGD